MIIDFRERDRINMPQWLERMLRRLLRISAVSFAAWFVLFWVAVALEFKVLGFISLIALVLPIVTVYAICGVLLVAIFITAVTASFRWAEAVKIRNPKMRETFARSHTNGLWDRDVDGCMISTAAELPSTTAQDHLESRPTPGESTSCVPH